MTDVHYIGPHESAVDYAQRMAGADATPLHRLAAAATEEGAHLWLSGSTVWAVTPEGGQWSAFTMTVSDAALWAQGRLQDVFASMLDPTGLTSSEERDAVLGAWEEFRTLYLASLDGGDPAAVDRGLTDRIEQARRWMSILGMLRAHHIRAAFGAERGAQAQAARTLGVSPALVSGILSDDEDRRGGWQYDLDEILAGRAPRDPFELD